MSESLRDGFETATRAHRCRPPSRAKIGQTFRCSCGTSYQFRQGTFRQWVPVTLERTRQS